MNPNIITIYGGYKVGSRKGELIMNHEYIEVEQGSDIEWVVDNDASRRPPYTDDVTSIDCITKKRGDDIFSEYPVREPNSKRKIKGKIKKNQSWGKQFHYNIHWTCETLQFKHDPIIAVKPTSPPPSDKGLFLAAALAIGTMIGFHFFRKKLTASKWNHDSGDVNNEQ